MAVGRWQSRCDSSHHHGRRSAPEGVRISDAAERWGLAVYLRGFGGRSLCVGAEPSERTLNAGRHNKRGATHQTMECLAWRTAIFPSIGSQHALLAFGVAPRPFARGDDSSDL